MQLHQRHVGRYLLEAPVYSHIMRSPNNNVFKATDVNEKVSLYWNAYLFINSFTLTHNLHGCNQVPVALNHTVSCLYINIKYYIICHVCRVPCAVKKNSSSSMGTFQIFIKWTFLTSGLVYQVPYSVFMPIMKQQKSPLLTVNVTIHFLVCDVIR